MAAIPYMPLFVADYLADAAHLTTIQHGAYLLLIMNYWQRGEPLPDDDVKLARIARMNKRDWARNRDEISTFFSIRDNLWHHGRIASELARVRAKSLKCKKAGRASAQHRLNERSTDEEQTFNHTDTDTSKTIDKSMDGKPSANEPEDPVKSLFDLGVSILTGAGYNVKQARSLIGKWREGGKRDAEVLLALMECRTKLISEPVEWLTKRLKPAQFVSKSGYQYRGDLDAIIRESEKRADWGTHWAAKRERDGAAKARAN